MIAYEDVLGHSVEYMGNFYFKGAPYSIIWVLKGFL